jgi:hypothetical protein
MEKQKVFADGFVFKRNENAPDFVIGSLSIKVEEAVAFLKQHTKNGWVNLQVKNSQGGKYYIELDTFEPKAQAQAPAQQPEPVNDGTLPF